MADLARASQAAQTAMKTSTDTKKPDALGGQYI